MPSDLFTRYRQHHQFISELNQNPDVIPAQICLRILVVHLIGSSAIMIVSRISDAFYILMCIIEIKKTFQNNFVVVFLFLHILQYQVPNFRSRAQVSVSVEFDLSSLVSSFFRKTYQ